MPTISVVRVSRSGSNAVVEYADNHKALFEPYGHINSLNVDGLRSYKLIQGNRLVFHYNGRLFRVGPRQEEHKVIFFEPQYTQQVAAEYWQAARNYLDREFFKKRDTLHDYSLYVPWLVVCVNFGKDFVKLSEGVAQVMCR